MEDVQIEDMEREGLLLYFKAEVARLGWVQRRNAAAACFHKPTARLLCAFIAHSCLPPAAMELIHSPRHPAALQVWNTY